MDVSASSPVSETNLCSSNKQGIISCRQLKVLVLVLYLSFTAMQTECRQQANFFKPLSCCRSVYRYIQLLMVGEHHHVLSGNALQGLWQHSRHRGGMSSQRRLAEETVSPPPGIAICAIVENPQEVGLLMTSTGALIETQQVRLDKCWLA